MAKQFPALAEDHVRFISEQPMFFVATAAPDGRVNLSPKGYDSLRVLGPSRIAWLNVTGSGNESAAHVARSPRMTLMWCSFGKRPLILRAYGAARVIHRGEPAWEGLASGFPDIPGARQVFDLAIDLVQTSCGYAVPQMAFTAERDTLVRWAETRGEDGITDYWAEKNRASIDGMPTGIEAALDRVP